MRACANEHVFVITSLAPPGVVIQLDGHGAERLAMTFSGFIAAITQAAALAAGSRNDKSLKQSGRWYQKSGARIRETRLQEQALHESA